MLEANWLAFIVVSDNEEVLNRMGHLFDKSKLYKIRLGFADSNFLIQKIVSSSRFIILKPDLKISNLPPLGLM
jgi:hypothetical protein